MRTNHCDNPGAKVVPVSMGGPYDGNYFKFVAAVIEL